jgi:hypothetical protein
MIYIGQETGSSCPIESISVADLKEVATAIKGFFDLILWRNRKCEILQLSIARNLGFKSDHFRTLIIYSFTSIPDSNPVISNLKKVSARSIITVEVYKFQGLLKTEILNFCRNIFEKKFSTSRIFVKNKFFDKKTPVKILF